MIKLIKSTFYKEAETKKKLISFISRASVLSFGTKCEEFEKDFASWQGRKYCVFLNSGSSANLAVIQALLNLEKLKHGDLIGVSSLTWSTNVMPIIQLGLRAVPIDINRETLNVSSKNLLAALKKHKLKMLFLTNALGFCDDIDVIREICNSKNIILIEDNCESLGTIYKGKKLGNYGDSSTFSFYVGHHMSTIEGGAVTTDDGDVATMLKLVRAHGWDRNLDFTGQDQIRKKFNVNSSFYSRYTFYDLGYNLRPTDINGFIGCLQVKYIDEIVKKRNKNFLKIARPIYQRSDIYYPVKFDHIDLLSNFAIPVICKSIHIREKLVRLCKNKVEIRPIIGGDMTRQPFFKKYMKEFVSKERSVAQLVHDQGLYFGNNPELTNGEMETIIDIFTKKI